MHLLPRGRLAAALGVPLLLSSCLLLGDGDGGTNTNPVALAVSPGQISLSSANPTAKLYVTTTPQGTLDWQITTKPDWVTVTPTSGQVKRQPVEVTVTADFSQREPGVVTDFIDIVSPGGAMRVGILATVSPNPTASLSVPSLQFAAGVDSVKVTLSNSGKGLLQWSTSGLPSWLTVAPASGTLSSGQSVQLTARVARAPLPGGTTTGSFTLQSNSTSGAALAVPVSVDEPATARAEVNAALLRYPSGVSEQTFVLRNLGKGPLQWTMEPSAAWMLASPSSGTVPVGGSAQVRVTVNRSMVANANGAITVKSNSTGGDLPLAVEVSSATPLSGVTVLSHGVSDAEYSPASGQVVMVTGTPSNSLRVIDPEFATQRSVALPAAPACVSVEPQGRYAAVCHNGSVSYVDLAEMRVVRTYSVPTDALDAVAGGNGWVYVFPRRDQWESIHNLNLSSGAVTPSNTIYAGVLAKLHPSGRYIYGADNGLSPSDIEKFDVRTGVSQAMYDSPYHGNYDMGGNLWFSEDGTRVFTRSGNVFRSSEVQSEDLLYMGSLSVGVRSVAHSTAAARVFALSYADPTQVRVHDEDHLNLRGEAALPRFPLPSGTASSRGEYVFVNAAGTRAYVLIRAGDTQLWGLAVMNVASMP